MTTAKSMTAADIRKAVSPMVIWMADTTIREARRAITGNTRLPKPNCTDYNLPEVEMAGEILTRMIDTFPAAVQDALVIMPAEYNGVFDRPGCNYFDEFINQLTIYLNKMPSRHPVTLRESDWILERV